MYQNSWSYALLFLRCGMWQMELLLLIWGYFLPFYSPNSLKNENFKKMKKNPEDIIILHRCTKNHDHMLYCSWNMACDTWHIWFLFFILDYFLPSTAQKIKISKKWNKHLEISSFHTCVCQKLWWDDIRFLRYGARWTDGWTDGQKRFIG